MGYINDYIRELNESASVTESAHQKTIQTPPPFHSQKALELAGIINRWHECRPVPERFRPIPLGRLSALLGHSREMTAAALALAHWTEKKSACASIWTPPNLTNTGV
jgi:hypothetical protein